MSNWKSFLDKEQDRFLSELIEFVKIPSVSASSEFEKDVVDAANWVATRITHAGGENVEVMQTGGHPCVYADWMHAGDEKPTVLIYGHFDVQPAEPYDLWDTPPFEPEIRDGKVFGRGASDDKGGMLIPIISFEAIKKTTGIQLIYNKNLRNRFINLPVCRRDFNITFNCFRFVRTQNMCLWSIYNF